MTWEENDSTEPRKNSMNNPNLECDGIMNDTKTKSENETLNDTMMRRCPSCNSELFYVNKRRFNQAVKLNKSCIKCKSVEMGKIRAETFRLKPKINYERNCPECNRSITYSCKGTWKKAEGGKNVCYNCSAKAAIKTKGMSLVDYSKFNRICPNCGENVIHKNADHRNRAERKKQNCRKCGNEQKKLSITNNLKGKFSWANYNPRSCDYLDSLSKDRGWEIRHARNGGEMKVLNYFLDGYDDARNIVVEYDETHHYDRDGKLKEKDVRRQNKIISHLNCRFFRYNERIGELYEVTKTV